VDGPCLTPYQSAFLHELSAVGIGFLVIGGKALVAHGIRRETYDLDVLVSRSGESPDLLFRVLSLRLSSPDPRLSPQWLREPKKLVSLPDGDTKAVDILTWIDDLDYDSAMAGSLGVSVLGVMVPFAGIDDLERLKRISYKGNKGSEAGQRDLDDLRALQRIQRKRGSA
jgi:hypothetical protein